METPASFETNSSASASVASETLSSGVVVVVDGAANAEQLEEEPLTTTAPSLMMEEQKHQDIIVALDDFQDGDGGLVMVTRPSSSAIQADGGETIEPSLRHHSNSDAPDDAISTNRDTDNNNDTFLNDANNDSINNEEGGEEYNEQDEEGNLSVAVSDLSSDDLHELCESDALKHFFSEQQASSKFEELLFPIITSAFEDNESEVGTVLQRQNGASAVLRSETEGENGESNTTPQDENDSFAQLRATENKVEAEEETVPTQNGVNHSATLQSTAQEFSTTVFSNVGLHMANSTETEAAEIETPMRPCTLLDTLSSGAVSKTVLKTHKVELLSALSLAVALMGAVLSWTDNEEPLHSRPLDAEEVILSVELENPSYCIGTAPVWAESLSMDDSNSTTTSVASFLPLTSHPAFSVLLVAMVATLAYFAVAVLSLLLQQKKEREKQQQAEEMGPFCAEDKSQSRSLHPEIHFRDMTLVQLKRECGLRGLHKTGIKQDLIFHLCRSEGIPSPMRRKLDLSHYESLKKHEIVALLRILNQPTTGTKADLAHRLVTARCELFNSPKTKRDQLRAELKERGLQVGGLKKVLAKRLAQTKPSLSMTMTNNTKTKVKMVETRP